MNLDKKFLLRHSSLLIYLILSFFSTVALLGRGELVGAGEAGIPFYSLQRVFEMSRYAWSDIFLGLRSELSLAAEPLYWLLSTLNSLGISKHVLQYGFFFFLIFFALTSMDILFKELFPKSSKTVQFSAALFYLFNAYSLMNIWNRFLINGIAFYCLLPFALAFYLKGLKKQKYHYSVLVAVFATAFSYAFGVPSSTLIFWLSLLFCSLYYFIFVKRGVFSFLFLIYTLLLWVFFNSWWILLQVYYRFSSAFSKNAQLFFSTSGNYSTFDILSKELGKLINGLLLKHGTFFSTHNEGYPLNWPHFYTHPIALLVQWLVFLLILWAAFRKSGNKWVNFAICLFVIGIFAIKGNSAPLGIVFNFLFQKVSLLQFFRNPFEKLGIILSISMSLLFGILVWELIKVFGKYKILQKLTIYTILLYPLLFWGYPFWTRLVFTSNNVPANNPDIGYKVEVPGYYQEANKWLSGKNEITRFITLPLGGEGIFYQWPKGYAGVEESAILFSNPSVSYKTTVPYYSSISSSLEPLFLENKDFSKIASRLNAKYVLYRPDFDHKLSDMRDPLTIKSQLDSSDSLFQKDKTKEFGSLSVYEFTDSLGKIFSAESAVIVDQSTGFRGIYAGGAENTHVLVLEDSLLAEERLIPEKARIISSRAPFLIEGPNLYNYSEEPVILPHVSKLPDSKFYKIVLLKEKIVELLTVNKEKKLEYRISLLGKRLIEAKKSIELGKEETALSSIYSYQRDVEKAAESIVSLSPNKSIREQIWRVNFLETVFGTHIVSLERMQSESKNNSTLDKEIRSTLSLTKNLAKELMVFPWYDQESEDYLLNNRQVYQFDVNSKGNYQLIFDDIGIVEDYKMPDELLLKVDNELVYRSHDLTNDGFLSLGSFYFDEGIHEISFNLPEGINLLMKNDNEYVFESDSEYKDYYFLIERFSPGGDYYIDFDYYIRSGNSPTLILFQDTDKQRNEKTIYKFEKTLPQDDYWFDFRHYRTRVQTSWNANTAGFTFRIPAWNNCLTILGYKPEECKIPEVRKSFDRKTEVVVKNLKVTRAFPTNPFLRIVNDLDSSSATIDAVVTKVNPTKYYVSLKDIKTPFLMVFSETYDHDWKVYRRTNRDTSAFTETWGKQPLFSDHHYLVNDYANSWWVNETGDLNFIIEYWPERIHYLGIYLSLSSILVTLMITVTKKIKKN